MDQQELNAKIGAAWKAHYQGDQNTAIQQFAELVKQAPDDIDVHWGIGLAFRRVGDAAKALDAFRRAKTLIDEASRQNPEERGRLFILNRMVSQHIEQLGDADK